MNGWLGGWLSFLYLLLLGFLVVLEEHPVHELGLAAQVNVVRARTQAGLDYLYGKRKVGGWVEGCPSLGRPTHHAPNQLTYIFP